MQLTVQKNVNLLPYNTFGVSVKAREFCEISSTEDIKYLPSGKKLVLGGGANILLTSDFDGLVIKNNLKGKKEISEGVFEIGSGEDWIELVNWAVAAGWGGIEHMAYIPGTVGGAIVGNIGAYGQTFEDVLVSVKASGQIFSKNECEFGYRESAFKHKLKDLFVESVTIKLSKNPGAFKIAEETTSIRKAKLPDWKVLPTAGSFFKNPFISKDKLEDLQKEFPDIPNFPNKSDVLIKIPAGFLLEKLGWKGKRIGNVGTYEKHALIVINFGGATGVEILEFTQKMQSDVEKNFGITLEPEVIII